MTPIWEGFASLTEKLITPKSLNHKNYFVNYVIRLRGCNNKWFTIIYFVSSLSQWEPYHVSTSTIAMSYQSTLGNNSICHLWGAFKVTKCLHIYLIFTKTLRLFPLSLFTEESIAVERWSTLAQSHTEIADVTPKTHFPSQHLACIAIMMLLKVEFHLYLFSFLEVDAHSGICATFSCPLSDF